MPLAITNIIGRYRLSSAFLDYRLREFACELTSSWPPAREERRVWAALLGKDPLNLVSVLEYVSWSNTPTFLVDFVKRDTLVQRVF